jgi:hypothetical protein
MRGAVVGGLNCKLQNENCVSVTVEGNALPQVPPLPRIAAAQTLGNLSCTFGQQFRGEGTVLPSLIYSPTFVTLTHEN